MAQHEGEGQSAELVGNDIVFDCVHCGKSLAIAVQGAGLNMKCPECGGDIYVPIPEGLELSDIDKSLDASSIEPDSEPIGETAESVLYDEDERVNVLATQIEQLQFRTQYLEKQSSQYRQATEALIRRVDAIREALKEMDDILADLFEKSADDTQQLG